MKDVKEILNEWFEINNWRNNQKEPRKLIGKLKDFGKFKVYSSFKELLEDNLHYLDDWDGYSIEIDEVLAVKDNFNYFLMDRSDDLCVFGLCYEKINEPLLFAEFNSPKPLAYVKYVDSFKTEQDLITFLNKVFGESAAICHQSGLKPEYEIVGVNKE